MKIDSFRNGLLSGIIYFASFLPGYVGAQQTPIDTTKMSGVVIEGRSERKSPNIPKTVEVNPSLSLYINSNIRTLVPEISNDFYQYIGRCAIIYRHGIPLIAENQGNSTRPLFYGSNIGLENISATAINPSCDLSLNAGNRISEKGIFGAIDPGQISGEGNYGTDNVRIATSLQGMRIFPFLSGGTKDKLKGSAGEGERLFGRLEYEKDRRKAGIEFYGMGTRTSSLEDVFEGIDAFNKSERQAFIFGTYETPILSNKTLESVVGFQENNYLLEIQETEKRSVEQQRIEVFSLRNRVREISGNNFGVAFHILDANSQKKKTILQAFVERIYSGPFGSIGISNSKIDFFDRGIGFSGYTSLEREIGPFEFKISMAHLGDALSNFITSARFGDLTLPGSESRSKRTDYVEAKTDFRLGPLEIGLTADHRWIDFPFPKSEIKGWNYIINATVSNDNYLFSISPVLRNMRMYRDGFSLNAEEAPGSPRKDWRFSGRASLPANFMIRASTLLQSSSLIPFSRDESGDESLEVVYSGSKAIFNLSIANEGRRGSFEIGLMNIGRILEEIDIIKNFDGDKLAVYGEGYVLQIPGFVSISARAPLRLF